MPTTTFLRQSTLNHINNKDQTIIRPLQGIYVPFIYVVTDENPI